MSYMNLETQMKLCGSCKLCKTTKAKPRIKLNLFSIYTKKWVLERYNPNSQCGEQLYISNACVYSWCMMVFTFSVYQGGRRLPTLPVLRWTDISGTFLGAVAPAGLSLYQSTARTGLCCSRAAAGLEGTNLQALSPLRRPGGCYECHLLFLWRHLNFHDAVVFCGGRRDGPWKQSVPTEAEGLWEEVQKGQIERRKKKRFAVVQDQGILDSFAVCHVHWLTKLILVDLSGY